MSVNQWGAVNQWSTESSGVNLTVTEISLGFSESSSASIVQAGVIGASVTEVSASFFDNSGIQVTGSFTIDATEVSEDFTETSFIQLPVIRLKPRKVIRVTGQQKTYRG